MAELDGPVTPDVLGRGRGGGGVVLDPPAVALSSAISRFWLCGDAYIIELLSTVFFLFFFLQPAAHQAQSDKQ